MKDSELPPPLLPPDVDLTDFPYMPLDVRRLRDSAIVAVVSAEEFRTAVMLWSAAWHQVPAGSLPDDDVQLANLSGFGRVVASWREVRDGALHGWIRCSDGRLWHPVVSEKAADAWNGKLVHKWKKECDRVRKENQSRTEAGLPQVAMPSRPQQVQAGDHGCTPSSHAGSTGNDELSAGNLDNADGNANPSGGIPAENALIGRGRRIEEDICPKPDKPVRTRIAYSSIFEQFWSAYPTDRNMSKLEAWKVWGKFTEDDRASAIAAIPGFVAHCHNNPTYRPVHAVRFLSQRRFDGFDPSSHGGQPPPTEPRIRFGGDVIWPETAVRQTIQRWKTNPGSWPPMIGEPPDKPGCRVPRQLLLDEGVAA